MCNTNCDCLVCAADFSIDALKKEAESLMIPGEKWPDYIGSQILRFRKEELKLERKEAEKQLERKEAEKQLELERIKINIAKTGLLWKLKTQTQRHALELFLFDCWERMLRLTVDEITQIRSKNKRFPSYPANTTVSATMCVL
jgi:hypothetical protein